MATENELLKQLPLKSSLNLHNEEYIKVLMKMYVILTKTTFSICIVGNPVPRSHLVQGLAQCLGKRTKRILLSTMTEIGDLLGSYEQVS